MSCNTAVNERGGKDLLLKICRSINNATVAIGTADTPTNILSTAHGLVVGDLIRFPTVPASVTEITADQVYYVTNVPSANAFKIADDPAGTAITFTDTIADLDFEAFETLGGLRTKSFAFASDAIENSNHGTNQWRQVVDDAGMRQLSLSGDGVYTNESTFEALEEAAFENTLTCLAIVDVRSGKVYIGCFKITALEASGAFDGEATYTMSAVSSGEVDRYTPT